MEKERIRFYLFIIFLIYSVYFQYPPFNYNMKIIRVY